MIYDLNLINIWNYIAPLSQQQPLKRIIKLCNYFAHEKAIILLCRPLR